MLKMILISSASFHDSEVVSLLFFCFYNVVKMFKALKGNGSNFVEPCCGYGCVALLGTKLETLLPKSRAGGMVMLISVRHWGWNNKR